MAIIFNEKGVRDCKPMSVAQTFINHNAILYKIYCVGEEYFVVERPSLKNFYSNGKSLFFLLSCIIYKKLHVFSDWKCICDLKTNTIINDNLFFKTSYYRHFLECSLYQSDTKTPIKSTI